MQKISEVDAQNYLKLLEKSKNIYDLAFCKLAHQPFHKLSTMIKQIPFLLKFRSYESVYKFTSRHLSNEKLRRAFSIQPLLVGGNPFDTTCIYSLIHYLERAHGVYFAMGGTGNLVKALSKLMVEIGVKITLNTTIEKFILKNKKVNSIIDHAGKVRKADIFISNLDPLHLYKKIIYKNNNFSLKYKKKYARHSMGLFVLFFGTKKKFNKIKHHTIIFGKEFS